MEDSLREVGSTTRWAHSQRTQEPMTTEPTRPTPKPRVAGEKTTAATEHTYDAVNELVVLRAAIAMLATEEIDSRAGALIRSISPDEFLYGTHPAIWQALRKIVDQKLDYSPAVEQISR